MTIEGECVPDAELQAEAVAAGHKIIPPDPEGHNDDRANWANVALGTFMRVAGCTAPRYAFTGLLCDLMHLADRNPQLGDFETVLTIARENYRDETSACSKCGKTYDPDDGGINGLCSKCVDAEIPAPLNGTIADFLAANFPWLDTDEEDISGADTLDQLQTIYCGLRGPSKKETACQPKD